MLAVIVFASLEMLQRTRLSSVRKALFFASGMPPRDSVMAVMCYGYHRVALQATVDARGGEDSFLRPVHSIAQYSLH